ncbi:TetR family transcriptional regulator [Kribbella voronezhensis]|uniref:TetR family transcriptional regulator n=1 Tax=Kribbella voronezhensis TaxID=2512212 RepID=A0A4R7THG7_9ACTN|nr:TetR/AcrR family transcriptional regulator C-terminal domain-containing protein [Kribbella voronezhensis]TDU91289.1 TetR family transcriptional regulator [Kribbella voronezhensis]
MEDAVRTLELLWGKAPAPRRGPNQTLTVDQLVTTAIGIADRDGLKGVTMRAVGKELDRTAMSLYTYVPGREVLITVMHDRVHAEVPTPRKIADWRKAVTAWCQELRELYVRHPWVLEVSQARPGFGPHEQDVLEGLLRLLARAEVPLAVRPTVTSALYSIVREAAKRKVEALAESAQSAEWWAERGKALQAVAPDFAERYPESTAIARHQSTQGPQPWIKAAEDAFTGAIALLLAGLS